MNAAAKPGKVVYPYKAEYDLYIGRQRRCPEPLKRSFWANPYRLEEHGGAYTLAESLYLYELRVRSTPVMLERLHEIVGKNPRLLVRSKGRYSAQKSFDTGEPEICHGQVLLQLAGEL